MGLIEMNLNKIKHGEARYHSFSRDVGFKYQLFNGLFLALPFQGVDEAGAILSIFANLCNDELKLGKTPKQIISDFFKNNNTPEEEKYNLLFRFLQFIERQVVLFDALEDAAFSEINDLSGVGTVDYLLHQLLIDDTGKADMLEDILKYYKIRVVLTAHPTQFYPNQILGIISDMSTAIKNNDLDEIRSLFLQMGLTRFSNKKKPTPLDEAMSLIWYLQTVFYPQIAAIQQKLPSENINLEMGFWPGGDRDGNPFVVADTTLKVAKKLRKSILRLYFKDLKYLRQKLTFDGVYDSILEISTKVIKDKYQKADDLINDLNQIITILHESYQSLFVNLVEDLILKIRIFNFYFVKLDIRQNSGIHNQVISNMFATHKIHADYSSLDTNEKIKLLKANMDNIDLLKVEYADPMVNEVLATVRAIHTVQHENGQQSIERYIISNTGSLANIFEVVFLIRLTNNYLSKVENKPESELIKVEVVPLFETIDDLKHAEDVMEALYQDPVYKSDLIQNQYKQTIMLGFSDGTKDGGYLMANWSIYLAKKTLTALADKYKIQVVFFDGRGGPPSRGGGNTRDFYHSLGANVATNEIQLTIQGQTISSNFGTKDSATYNLEQLFTSGLMAKLFPDNIESLSVGEEKLIALLAEECYLSYLDLRHDEMFVPYLEEITPLKYLAAVNIGSRPTKRNKDNKLRFEDLRAIPFVGAWTQMKQNILGYYGLGTGIRNLFARSPAYQEKLKKLYQESLFFRTLINNAMQSLSKSNFAISSHLEHDKKFGRFWCKLRDETELTKQMLLSITGHNELLSMDAIKQESINLREKIVLPLLVIQQYALEKLREDDKADTIILERLVKKSLAANINASRNSV
jgi:phosphoenolpyruvate carboxylase